uniref:ATP-dependent helicase Rep n=1 Tax=uncultured virus TaxID=340016 RepID=A0A1D8MK45_9VIRU|nr:putative rep protein [uncultured virus]
MCLSKLHALEHPVQMSSLRKSPSLVDPAASASPSVRSRKRRAQAESEEKEPESLPELAPEPVGKGRARNYCFTVNKEVTAFYNHWETCDLPSLIQFIVFQKEVAPETGHLHVQGYVQLTKALSLKQVQVLLRTRCHLEKANGSASQNIAYCTKVDSRLDGSEPVQRGSVKEPGRRTDLEALAERVVAVGAVTAELAREHPSAFVRNYRGLQALARITSPPMPRSAPRVVYLVGPPGCGKSRLAHLMWPNAYNCTDQKEGWFDGYNNESCVIFDDFEGNFPLRPMLKLLDYYPMQLPVKGGFVPVAARTFVFTSNVDPAACYCNNDAWMRRLRDFGEIWDAERVQQKLHALLASSAEMLDPPRLTRSLARTDVIDLTKEAACVHGNQEDSCSACREM